MFKESEDTSTKGTRERGVDRHEEKVIKPGFRQAFMGSQTQTSFEALKRFWATTLTTVTGGRRIFD